VIGYIDHTVTHDLVGPSNPPSQVNTEAAAIGYIHVMKRDTSDCCSTCRRHYADCDRSPVSSHVAPCHRAGALGSLQPERLTLRLKSATTSAKCDSIERKSDDVTDARDSPY
jgi:hypothetical protein